MVFQLQRYIACLYWWLLTLAGNLPSRMNDGEHEDILLVGGINGFNLLVSAAGFWIGDS
jgi:hypothetical protein